MHANTLFEPIVGFRHSQSADSLQAELAEGRLRFKDKSLEVGPVACGVPQTRTVQVHNAGAADAGFRVLADDSPLRVSPDRGKVILALSGCRPLSVICKTHARQEEVALVSVAV